MNFNTPNTGQSSVLSIFSRLINNPSNTSIYTKTAGILFLIITLLILGSCSSSVPDVRYYLLDYVPSPLPNRVTQGPLPYSLRIKTINVSEAYRRPEIVYRQSAHELLFYNYHKWAIKPELLVTDMLFKHLREARLFSRVTKNLSDFDGDYSLGGEVLAIEEFDSGKKWYAHLALTYTLEDNRTRKQVWQKTYDYRKRVGQTEPVFVIRELSALLEYINGQVCMELEKFFLDSTSQNFSTSTNSSSTDPALQPTPTLSESVNFESESIIQSTPNSTLKNQGQPKSTVTDSLLTPALP